MQRRSPVNAFFGVVTRTQTWLNVVYLWLSFPLGLFYFVFLVTGLSVGLSLVIIWVGIPVVLLVAGAWWLFAAFERLQARYLLRVPVAPSSRGWERGDTVWQHIKEHFLDGQTWKDLVFLLVKFGTGTASFTLLVTLLSLCTALMLAPIFEYQQVPLFDAWLIPSPAVAWAMTAAGMLAVFASLHILNAWAWVNGKLALALLGRERAASSPQPGPSEVTTNAPRVEVAS